VANNEDVLGELKNPLVFISHDTRDADLAEAFSALLKCVSAGVLKSFRTSDRKGNQGIEYGVEWYPEIIKNIQASSDVVCLLTKRSVDRPWILFEAGMAKGKLDTPILGVALGIELKEISTGPFAQFQNCGDDEDSLTKLVFQLVNRIPNSEPDTETIKFQIGRFKTSVAEILAKSHVTSKSSSTKVEQNTNNIENSSARLFEEIKIMFQDLPSRIERSENSQNSAKRRRLSRRMMVEEMIHSTRDPRMRVRVCLSFYRDKMPWVYDEGTHLLNKLDLASDMNSVQKQINNFDELLMSTKIGPHLERMLMDSDEDYRMFRELRMLITDSLKKMTFDFENSEDSE